jgi:acetoacetyl-CoA synthetase
MTKPLWTPGKERINKANMTRFIAFVNREYGLELTDYDYRELFSAYSAFSAVIFFGEIRTC